MLDASSGTRKLAKVRSDAVTLGIAEYLVLLLAAWKLADELGKHEVP